MSCSFCLSNNRSRFNSISISTCCFRWSSSFSTAARSSFSSASYFSLTRFNLTERQTGFLNLTATCEKIQVGKVETLYLFSAAFSYSSLSLLDTSSNVLMANSMSLSRLRSISRSRLISIISCKGGGERKHDDCSRSND